jgi:uncharacterized membrane protein (UPF0127 family)
VKSFLNPLLRDPDLHYALKNARTTRIVADDLLRAFDSRSRRKGLLGRTSLPAGTAMIIAPSNAVHTFGMQFPIDIAFVSKDGRVLKTRRAVPPRRMTASLRAHAVIEMAAGSLEQSQTEPGDVLTLATTS